MARMTSAKEQTAAEPTARPQDAGTGTDLAALRGVSFEKRVDQTMRWLISGARDVDILEAIAEAWPKQNQTKLLTAVMKKFTEAAELPPDFVRGWIFESRRELYRQMVEIGDFPAALRALRDMETAAR